MPWVGPSSRAANGVAAPSAGWAPDIVAQTSASSTHVSTRDSTRVTTAPLTVPGPQKTSEATRESVVAAFVTSYSPPADRGEATMSFADSLKRWATSKATEMVTTDRQKRADAEATADAVETQTKNDLGETLLRAAFPKLG